ncbi:MAG: restriction endonuclease subunit S [Myxococcales bacterium]|nr:restriction endonuclease subunit S [Myxococcales bacterium]
MEEIRQARLRRFRPYSEYRNTDLAWPRALPSHWEILRLKLAAGITAGQSPPSEAVRDAAGGLKFLQGNAEFGEVNPTPRFSCDEAPKRAKPGDILLSVRAPVGAINVADQPYGIGRGLCAIRPRSGLAREYAYYLLFAVRWQLNLTASGSTYDAVTAGDVGDLTALVPSLSEQRAIASFLDRETAKIDELVAKKEQLIELLQQKRTALITRAVTQGLDPNVFMKDSGVEWLGRIPAHWDLKPLKYLIAAPLAYGVLKPDKYEGGDGVLLIRILDVEMGEVHENQVERISPEQSIEYCRTIVNPGDLILSVVGTIGRCFVVPESLAGANLSRALARIQLGPQGDARFVEYLFASTAFRTFVDLIPAGTAQKVLNLGDLADFVVPLPQVREQREIVNRLDQEVGAVDSLARRIAAGIERLKEFRTALISAAVTGKIDVREDSE